jgi:hypothetical protein
MDLLHLKTLLESINVYKAHRYINYLGPRVSILIYWFL